MASSTALHNKFKNVKFVGRIPADWDVKKIGDVFDVQLGKMLSKASKTGKHFRPYLGNWNVKWGTFDLDRVEQMDFRNGEIEKFALKPGDVLICEGGEVGRTAIWDGQIENCCYQKALHRLRPKNGQVLPHFFMYYMQEAVRQNIFLRYTNESSIAHLTRETLIDVQMPVPPLSEQRVIEETLGAVDDAMERTRAVIDQTRKLKTALLQDLLTNGLPGRHTEFQRDRWIGIFPASWSLLSLSDVVDAERKISYGIVQAGQHIEDGVPYIRVSDMTQRHLTLDGMLRTTPEIAHSYRRSAVRTGDIVFALRGDIGCVHIVPAELDGANLTQGTARISASDKIDTGYLLWALRSEAVCRLLDRDSKGSTFKEIALKDLERIVVPVPQDGEQQEIASALNGVVRRIWATEDQLQRLSQLKASLSQTLLTGRVRVPTKGGE